MEFLKPYLVLTAALVSWSIIMESIQFFLLWLQHRKQAQLPRFPGAFPPEMEAFLAQYQGLVPPPEAPADGNPPEGTTGQYM